MEAAMIDFATTEGFPKSEIEFDTHSQTRKLVSINSKRRGK
jgi:hypothetical protein